MLTSIGTAVVMENIRLSDIDLAVDPPRPLTDEERDTLAFLLEKSFLGRDELREQLRTAKVGAESVCVCRTVQFVIDKATPPVPERTTLCVPVEAEGEDATERRSCSYSFSATTTERGCLKYSA
jgi:hypothetical protein